MNISKFNSRRSATGILSLLVIILLAVWLLLFIVGARNPVDGSYYMVVLQTFVTLLALFVALIATLAAIKRPKLVCSFIDQHECNLELIDGKYIPLGLYIEKESRIGYLPYSPTDWEIIINNVGKKVAENIRIEISIEGVAFVDKSNLFDVKNFIYGFGCYNTLVFDFETSLGQGESIRVPKIPFQYSESDFQDGQLTDMHIEIFCSNTSVTKETRKIIVQRDELGVSSPVDEIIYDEELIEIIKSFGNAMDVENQGFYYDMNPYCIDLDENCSSKYQRIYNTYLSYNSGEYSSNPNTRNIINYKLHKKLRRQTIFWGRVYYRSIGYSKNEIELMIHNDMFDIK